MGLPDSGIGMFAGKYLNDRVNLAGAVCDANADRTEFGEITEGELFAAIELQVNIPCRRGQVVTHLRKCTARYSSDQ
jgi:hypothetical protein